jgi:hypothetical protein
MTLRHTVIGRCRDWSRPFGSARDRSLWKLALLCWRWPHPREWERAGLSRIDVRKRALVGLGMVFVTKPLDASTWPDFAHLVEDHHGVWSGCWF